MIKLAKHNAFVGLWLILTAGPALADPPPAKSIDIGDPAPPFSLPGVDGKTHSLADFADAKALVVVFTCNHCPTAQAYEARIEALHRDWKEKGVRLVAISPNDPKAVRLDELGYTDYGDSFEEMKARAKDRKFSYPYLYDGETQAVAKAYGALATPHVFVFDSERKLRYSGRVDDDEKGRPQSLDATDAIAAVLAGKPVKNPKTRVFGCSIKWAEKQADAKRSLAKWDAEPVSLDTIDEAGIAKLSENASGKLLLVNVWATWCGPCVQEMPDLVEINRMYRGRPFSMVTISLDEPDKKNQALEVLTKNHVSCKNYLASFKNRDAFMDALDKQAPGPIPYSILIDPKGNVVERISGAFDPVKLKQAIVSRLGRIY